MIVILLFYNCIIGLFNSFHQRLPVDKADNAIKKGSAIKLNPSI